MIRRRGTNSDNSSATLFQRLKVMDLDSYYNNRILRWAGHVARMPMTRAPRQSLTSWVEYSRPNGCPEMTWGRTLKKALQCKGLPVSFKEWRATAADRSEWISRTYSKLMPPSELPRLDWSYRVQESKDARFITQKWAYSPVRLVLDLEDSSKRSLMLFVDVSLQLGSII